MAEFLEKGSEPVFDILDDKLSLNTPVLGDEVVAVAQAATLEVAVAIVSGPSVASIGLQLRAREPASLRAQSLTQMHRTSGCSDPNVHR
ncbi:hypothetical protein RB195_001077 [Necator americanus]|uniref:Uncharacterized protein n=1 Tax=Necator americanus TaxID=51031 RepID=A0ABR1DDG8_NECAM